MESLGKAAPVSRAEMKLNQIAQARGQKNARFHALPPDKKRVVIAKDVLKWLSAGKLTPSPQYYLTLPREVDDVVNGYSCSACALGAVFACAVERGAAGGTLKDEAGWAISERHSITARLAPYFDIQQLALIEVAFEQGIGVRSLIGTIDESSFDAARTFAMSKAPTVRMVAIMCNIIRNKGTFVPTDLG